MSIFDSVDAYCFCYIHVGEGEIKRGSVQISSRDLLGYP